MYVHFMDECIFSSKMITKVVSYQLYCTQQNSEFVNRDKGGGDNHVFKGKAMKSTYPCNNLSLNICRTIYFQVERIVSTNTTDCLCTF